MMVEKVLKRFEEEVNSYVLVVDYYFKPCFLSLTGASEVSSLEEAGAEKVGGAEPSPGPLI
jgi:hypothetical protein